MRSRYCAYAMGLVPYIMHTTAPGSPHHEDDETAWAASIEAFCQGVHFTGLRILDSPDPMGDEGSVRFVAQLDQNGRDVSFEENSRFVKVDARWLYDRAI